MPSPAPSIARSALWNHLGKVADYALMYAVSVLVARGLGVDLYGRYTALISLLHVLLVASSFGLEAALTKYGAGLHGASVDERLRFLFRRGAAVRVILFLVMAIAGTGLAIATGWARGSADLPVILLLGGYALSRAVLPLFVAILTARFRTDRVAVISVAGRLCELAGIIIVGSAGLTLPAVLGVLCVAGIVQIVLHLAWNARAWWGDETAIPLTPVLLFGGVFWLNALVDYFLGRQGDIALLAMIGGDPSATSRYDVSYTLMQAGAMIATLGLTGVSLAALSRFGDNDAAPRTRLYETLVRINSLLTIPVLGFIFVAAPDILGIIYAGPYVAATSVLRLLVGIRIITRICAGGENADLLLSMNMVKPLVAIGVIAAGVTIALHAVLIPRFAAEGAAVASGLGTLAANVLGVRRAQRVLPLTIQWRSWFALTGLTVLAGGGAHLAVPAAPTLVLLATKLAIFSVVWLFAAVLVRPLEMHDAAVFGRSLALLRKPMGAAQPPGGRRMRITYIAQDVDEVTGLGRIALAYARAMVSAGHEVTLVCQRSSATDLHRRIVPGFPRVPAVDKFLFRFAEPRRSRAVTSDIRHAFGVGSWAGIVSAQSCHRSGVELQRRLPSERMRRRNFGVYDFLSLQDERRLMTSPKTRTVLAVSHLVRTQLLHWYDLPEEKIVVLPNGIDTARYAAPFDREAVRAKYGMAHGSLVLGFLGNEFDRKGVQTIIEALPVLRDLPLNVYIGGADDPAPFIRRAGKLAVRERIHFVGRVHEPEEFLRTLDMFVFPVHYEPFGMVVTEAMAAGVPVITARAVGAVEGMTDGQQGVFLGDPLSAAELASAIRRLASDEAMRSRIGRAGREAASAFDWRVICARLESIYRSTTGGSAT